MTRRMLIVWAAAALLALALAAPALALTASVRVEASDMTLAPQTVVTLPDGPVTFRDSDGNTYRRDFPCALAATAAAATKLGFTWSAAYGGAFVTNIGGFTSLPDWSNGWVYMVNGVGYPVVDAAAIDFPLRDGDSVLWAQSPDSTFSRGSVALVLRTNGTPGGRGVALTTGEDLVVTVVGDDLAKVNSQADYERFGLSDPTQLETPDQFRPVPGARVHVGSVTYLADDNGAFTLSAPAPGTYRVWAEKFMDDTTWYVRTPQLLVNVADPLSLSDAAVAPNPFLPGVQKPVVSFTLSRAAQVTVRVLDAGGKTLWKRSVWRNGGAGSVTWSGRTSAGRLVPRHARFEVRVSARDAWGRTTPASALTLRSR